MSIHHAEMNVMNAQLQACADAVWRARATRTPIAPLRQWLAADAIGDAYAVQSIITSRRLDGGARRVGRKIGLTSQSIQKQLGVDRPDFGVLFDDMHHAGPRAAVPMARLIQPRIEGEIAFVVADDILEPGLPRDVLVRKGGHAAAAFEIVDSAIADWKISLADTVADNASCGALVVGHERRVLASFDARLAGMVMTEDDKIVSIGVGAASLGDPVAAFAWLADLAIAQGDPIRAGEIVLTGALGPMVPFVAGRRYRLEIAGFGPLEVLAEG